MARMPQSHVLAKFSAWLEEQGALVESSTNPYEAVRFRAGGVISILYRKQNGAKGKWTGDAEAAFRAFESGSTWQPKARKKLGAGVSVHRKSRDQIDYRTSRAFSGVWATLHSDASGSADHPPMAWAGWATSAEGKIFPAGVCPEDLPSTNEAELHGIVETLRAALAEFPDLDGVLVVCDSMYSIERLAGARKPGNDACRALLETFEALLGERWAVFRWQRGHRGDGTRSAAVNRAVDRAAKRERQRAQS